MSLEELLIREQGISVHCKQMYTLLTEIYKTFSVENLYFMKSICTKKDVIYNQKIKPLNPTKNKYKEVWSLLF